MSQYQQILVPVDGSKISLSAVKKAAQLAVAFNSKLTLVSLVAEDPFSNADFYYSASIMRDYFVQAYENAEKALVEAAQVAKDVGVEASTEVVKGLVSAEGVVATATQYNADLIVMGSHGRKGFQKVLLGSFAQDVLSNTELPVLIVKA